MWPILVSQVYKWQSFRAMLISTNQNCQRVIVEPSPQHICIFIYTPAHLIWISICKSTCWLTMYLCPDDELGYHDWLYHHCRLAPLPGSWTLPSVSPWFRFAGHTVTEKCLYTHVCVCAYVQNTHAWQLSRQPQEPVPERA